MTLNEASQPACQPANQPACQPACRLEGCREQEQKAINMQPMTSYLIKVIRGIFMPNFVTAKERLWKETDTTKIILRQILSIALSMDLCSKRSLWQRYLGSCDYLWQCRCVSISPWTSAVRGVAGFSVNFPFQQKARSFYQMHQERLIKQNNQTFWTRTVWPDTGIKCSPNFKIVA